MTEEERLIFADEPEEDVAEVDTANPWVLMIVDDEQTIHDMTMRVLDDFTFENRPLKYLNAYSGREAIKLMEANLEEPIPPSAVAEKLGITTRQLERLFGRYMNCSPKKFYVDLRLQKARNLLMQTEDSITSISVACGFNSTAHFTKAFKTQFGAPPGSYRSFQGVAGR